MPKGRPQTSCWWTSTNGFPEHGPKLKPDQRLAAKCYGLAAPTAVRLTVEFAANREARPEEDKSAVRGRYTLSSMSVH